MLGQQQQQRPEVPAPQQRQAVLEQQQQQPSPEQAAHTGSVQPADAATALASNTATAQMQPWSTQQAAGQANCLSAAAAAAAEPSAEPVKTSGTNAAAGQPQQVAVAPAAGPADVRPAASVSASDPRLEKVGFAKLLGDGVEYYIQKYEIVLGRKSKVPVDVVLGDSAVLSRQHCRIVYNFQAKKWQLVIEGKNGVSVNGVLHTPASGPYNLTSQDLLQAGDVSLYFLLPKQPRKPKSKPALTAGTEPQAVAAHNSGQTSCVPDTPVLGGAGTAAAAPAVPQPLARSSPTLPQTMAQSPMLLSPRTAAADAGTGLQPYQSGPLLPGLGLSSRGPLLGDGFEAVAVQGYSTGAEALAGNQDLLQPGLGDEFDDGVMEA